MNKIKKNDSWVVTMWRPALAWSYVLVCLFDFALGPILYNILQYLNPGQHVAAYTSVTLQGSGMYHISMGAIVGLSSHGRTQEKIKIQIDQP